MTVNKIQGIDHDLTELVINLKSLSKKIEFEEICEFEVGDENCDLPYDKMNFQGIYLFEIKNQNKHDNFEDWLEDIKERWEDRKFKYRFTPNFIKKRIKQHNTLEDYIPFYLGIRYCVKDRIKDHLHMSLSRNTFGMKLMSRENMKGEKFKLSVYELPVEHYSIIAPLLEKEIRNRINPLVGR